MNSNKICAFFGHRTIMEKDNIGKSLFELIKNLIECEGFSTFLFGSFGDFDSLCYSIVTALKTQYPHIKRILYVVNKSYLKTYLKKNVGSLYEEVVFPELDFDFWYTRIYYRNCYMIDISDLIIFYATVDINSGAYKALKYAVKKKTPFINLANS